MQGTKQLLDRRDFMARRFDDLVETPRNAQNAVQPHQPDDGDQKSGNQVADREFFADLHDAFLFKFDRCAAKKRHPANRTAPEDRTFQPGRKGQTAR